jgi:hypothetical protein
MKVAHWNVTAMLFHALRRHVTVCYEGRNLAESHAGHMKVAHWIVTAMLLEHFKKYSSLETV